MMQQPRGPAAPVPRTKRMTLAAVQTGVVREPERLLIYASGGVGKSTFLAETPSPIFIDTQKGTTRLPVARFPQPQNWQDVLDALDSLAESDHQYKTLCIDLLDDIEQLIWAHVSRANGKPNLEAIGYGKGPKIALTEWRIMLSKIERLQREKGMAVGFAAHVLVKTFKNPEGEDYDRYQLQLNELASGQLRGWCDTVLFARHAVRPDTDKKERTRGVAQGFRVLHTVETGAYYAKNRDCLPDTLALDYATYAAAVEAGTPANPEDVKRELAGLLHRVTDDALRAGVNAEIEKSGNDARRLVRVLNKLRERVQPEPQTDNQSNEESP